MTYTLGLFPEYLKPWWLNSDLIEGDLHTSWQEDHGLDDKESTFITTIEDLDIHCEAYGNNALKCKISCSVMNMIVFVVQIETFKAKKL